MQISLNWLNEFVDLSGIEVAQIAHELTMSGLEVEEIEEIKPKFTNIKTVKIEKIDNHPNSDRLHLVTVNLGDSLKTVVCGAQNIQEGQIRVVIDFFDFDGLYIGEFWFNFLNFFHF